MADAVKDNVAYLPVWKKGSTVEEWFQEFAMLARGRPERFGKVAVVYEETCSNGNMKVRQCSHGCSTTELVGLLELGKLNVVKDTEA